MAMAMAMATDRRSFARRVSGALLARRVGALTRSAPCPVSSHPFEPSASYCVIGWSPALLRMLFFKGR
jgi:hypothetical protein